MWTTARNLFHQVTILLGQLEDEKFSEDLVKSLKESLHYIKNPLVNKVSLYFEYFYTNIMINYSQKMLHKDR